MTLIRLRNGVLMPQIGFGTYKIRSYDDIHRCLDHAILKCGYKHIDTAAVYRNEAHIAQAIEALGLDRRDLFITTKLAPKDQGREAAEKAVKQALINLNTDYIDLFLIHWPGTQRLDPQDPSNQTLRTESWQVLEEYHKAGTLKAIGVSNFEIGHLKQLFQACQVQPHVNQIEVHPLFQNRDLTKFCQENNIHVTAYSSLGTTVSQNVLLSNDVVKLVADKANKTPAQILLKWATLKGYSVLPKSTNLDHILENISLDFKIPKEDLELLDGLEQDKKLTWNPKAVA